MHDPRNLVMTLDDTGCSFRFLIRNRDPGPIGSVSVVERMNREQFYAAMAGLDEDRLRKVLWTLYWRSAASVRQRIETELAPEPAKLRTRAAGTEVDPEGTLARVQEFVGLARAGSYLAGDRRVSPKERTRWRFTFRRLVTEARQALQAEDIRPGVAAVTAMIDLACEVRGYEYFRSDDPVEAAGVVVSDEVGAMWQRMLAVGGFPAFAAEAAEQFLRWEAPYGWTRRGFGRVSQKETALTTVLAGILTVPDAWTTFAICYLAGLDRAAATPTRRSSSWGSSDYVRADRAEAMAGWHVLLLDRFAGTDDEPLLDRIATHPGLGGPELIYFQAQLAHRRGDDDAARTLITAALGKLPGHEDFLRFAHDLATPLPPGAARIAEERALFRG